MEAHNTNASFVNHNNIWIDHFQLASSAFVWDPFSNPFFFKRNLRQKPRGLAPSVYALVRKFMEVSKSNPIESIGVTSWQLLPSSIHKKL
jgi:hypothetical protein